MSEETAVSPEYILELAVLFERINKGRKMRSLTPVENNAIVSRCNLRFNIGREDRVDFTQERITLSAEDIKNLEQMLNDQFDCMLEGDVQKLCKRVIADIEVAPKSEPLIQEAPKPAVTPSVDSSKKQTGFVSKIRKVFGSE